MSNVQIETGTLYANVDERTVSGLLLPYGEVGRTNIGKFSVAAGSVEIPADPTVVTLNVQHERERPVGRATSVTDTPAGIVGTFRIADTPEGDAVLLEIADGIRSKLSAEVARPVIKARQMVSGSLFGAAVVEAGAFESAALYAADTPDAEYAPDTTPVIEAEPAPADEPRLDEIDTPTEIVAESVDEDDETPTEKEDEMENARAPQTIATAEPVVNEPVLAEVVQRLTTASRSGARSMFAELMATTNGNAATNLFAALEDVDYNAVGGVGAVTRQPQWLDELWSGRTYARKYMPLIGSAALSGIKIQAWRWTTPPAVGVWTGNKADVPSNAPATESVEVTATRYAGAHDISREYTDFGNTSFIDSYLRAMAASYAKITDEKCLDDLMGGANLVAPSSTGVWNSIVDGIESVIDKTVPTFAVVSADYWRELFTTADSDKLAYLNASMGIESGTAAGFSIIPSASLPAASVLVGSREAATAYELPGAPVRVEGLDVSRGGVDIGLFGYYATVVNAENALAFVYAD